MMLVFRHCIKNSQRGIGEDAAARRMQERDAAGCPTYM